MLVSICFQFTPEFDVDIADHMISQVVTNVAILNLAVLRQLLKNVLIKILVTASIGDGANIKAKNGRVCLS